MYVTHPGVVVSSLFPVPWILMWAYRIVLVFARWLGSPWHNVDSYPGAKAATWVALADQDYLDDLDAESVKWGSSLDRRGKEHVKKTEVFGWGWEGKPMDSKAIKADDAVGVLHKSVGRYELVDTTAEDIVKFEEQGARCWKEMEALRKLWDEILDEKDALDAQINGTNGKH